MNVHWRIQKTQRSYIFTLYSLLYLYLYLYLYNFFFYCFGDTKDAAKLHLYSLLFICICVCICIISLSLSNFFDSENIGLRHSLSLSKKFDRDNERLNPILEHIFYTVLMSNFLARWQDGKKQHMIRNKEFRQWHCIYSTSERYSLKGHLKVRRFFLQCTTAWENWVCQASESARDMRSCLFYAAKARQIVCYKRNRKHFIPTEKCIADDQKYHQ